MSLLTPPAIHRRTLSQFNLAITALVETLIISTPSRKRIRKCPLRDCELNKTNGLYGRQVEDFANNIGADIQKTRKLIYCNEDDIISGNVNFDIAYIMSQTIQ